MNCKPGDLAIVVDALPAGRFLIGRLFDIVERAPDGSLGPQWVVRLHSVVYNPRNGLVGVPGDEDIAADCFLRPIRPGDISDEEVRDLYAPNTTKEAA